MTTKREVNKRAISHIMETVRDYREYSGGNYMGQYLTECEMFRVMNGISHDKEIRYHCDKCRKPNELLHMKQNSVYVKGKETKVIICQWGCTPRKKKLK